MIPEQADLNEYLDGFDPERFFAEDSHRRSVQAAAPADKHIQRKPTRIAESRSVAMPAARDKASDPDIIRLKNLAGI